MFTPTTAYITLISWLVGLLTLTYVPGPLAFACAPAAATTVAIGLARVFQLDRDTTLRAVALISIRALIAAVVGVAGLALRALTAAETRLAQPQTHPTYIRAV